MGDPWEDAAASRPAAKQTAASTSVSTAPGNDPWEAAAKSNGSSPAAAATAPEKPGILDRADEAITSTLAPNPANYSSAIKTNAIEAPKTLGREVYSGAKSILGAPGAIYHAITDKPTPEETGLSPEQLPIYRMGIKPVANAIQDYSSGKVTPDAALENAPEAIGQGAGTVVGSKIAETIGPKAIGAAGEAISRKPIPIAPEDAARGLTKAVNPSVNEWPNYIKANAEEAGNIKAFAEKNNLPLKTQLDWAKAAKGAADETNGYFKEKVLGPHANETVSTTGTGFKGKASGEGQTATLAEVNKRIGDINDELRSAYQKREVGQTREALANEPELKAEQKALADILHKELAQRTGLTPEQIGGIRQRFGRMYSVADQTEAAVNQRQSSAGKANEGRRDVPVSVAGVGVDLFNRVVRGGPEGIANRGFVRALDKTKAIPVTDLPEVQPPTPASAIGRPIIPREELSPGKAIPIQETSPEEIAAQAQKLQDRSSAVLKSRNRVLRRPIWEQE
jgi:hypothetical protein